MKVKSFTIHGLTCFDTCEIEGIQRHQIDHLFCLAAANAAVAGVSQIVQACRSVGRCCCRCDSLVGGPASESLCVDALGSFVLLFSETPSKTFHGTGLRQTVDSATDAIVNYIRQRGHVVPPFFLSRRSWVVLDYKEFYRTDTLR